ncbi:hypothetical protein BZA05DRAFT_407937 [Tricharina praecox]|uniref:uncharacterized protein n=1 Tax=Tricharina praecox TaxID=43433 RepID=UPI0022203650|nr:uncharacterized protein BZA05DRAFT_407937 [Tricharina praecox]KAI5845520.1 hypothetical protein BZA05DRAFT_407937 [Tricharina praecox]
MFRLRLKKEKLAVKEFAPDLTELGVFVNDADQIRQIEKPDEPWEFHVHGKHATMDMHKYSERMNRRRGEALNECVRHIALERLAKLNVNVVRLPREAVSDPSGIKHVRILASSGLSAATRILFIAPDSDSSDLGIHSYRHSTSETVREGCMQSIVEHAQASGYDGIVIANPAGIYWDHLSRSAITNQTWKARELKVVQPVSGAVLDPDSQRIPGHENPENHIARVLEYVKEHLRPEAQVDFVATGYTSFALLQGLSNDFAAWKLHAHAGILAESAHSIEDFKDHELREFVRKRCRNYILHTEALGSYVEANFQQAVNCYSCGTTTYKSSAEIVPIIEKKIFEYFARAYELDAKAAGNGGEGEGEDEEMLNNLIPIMMGKEYGAAHKEWIKELAKLDLGHETPGWEVPGAEVVEELRKMAEEEKSVWENSVKVVASDSVPSPARESSASPSFHALSGAGELNGKEQPTGASTAADAESTSAPAAPAEEPVSKQN